MGQAPVLGIMGATSLHEPSVHHGLLSNASTRGNSATEAVDFVGRTLTGNPQLRSDSSYQVAHVPPQVQDPSSATGPLLHHASPFKTMPNPVIMPTMPPSAAVQPPAHLPPAHLGADMEPAIPIFTNIATAHAAAAIVAVAKDQAEASAKQALQTSKQGQMMALGEPAFGSTHVGDNAMQLQGGPLLQMPIMEGGMQLDMRDEDEDPHTALLFGIVNDMGSFTKQQQQQQQQQQQ